MRAKYIKQYSLNHKPGRVETAFIYSTFLYAILFPVFHQTLGSAGAILVNGGLIILTLLYMSLFRNSRIQFHSKKEHTLVKRFSYLFFFYLFAISISTAFSEMPVLKDFYELHRPLLFYLTFLTSFSFFRKPSRFGHVDWLLILSFIFVLMLGLNHYFGFQDQVSELYTKAVNIRTRRVTVPFPNPYDYSFFMLLMTCYFLISAIKEKLYFRRSLSLLLGLISILGIIATQSRTGLILLAIELFFIIPFVILLDSGLSLKNLRISKKLLRYLVLILIIIFGVYYLYVTYSARFSYLIVGLERLANNDVTRSGQIRIDLMKLALDKASGNFFIFLFGNGPSKAILENPEAGYAYFIFRYGFSTLLFFFFLPLSLSCFYLAKIIRQKDVDTRIYMIVLAWYLSIPFAYFFTNFTEQIRLSFLYYFLMGFSIKSYFLLPFRESLKVRAKVEESGKLLVI